MEFKLNLSPRLKMSDITKRIFNENFHSDIQFSVAGELIYAHSLELMKRSVVFEEQLEKTVGTNKLIPIIGFKYESFLEFIRFIYTDECNVTTDNGIEILKLAKKYKVLMLENKVIHFCDSDEWFLKLYEYCIVEKYELVQNLVNEMAADSFGRYLLGKEFLSLQPEVVEALLKFDYIEIGITEAEIFDALGNWITSYCETHQMTMKEGREQFDKLIRLIRFPTMQSDEIKGCAEKFPELLTENDRKTIEDQGLYGDVDKETNLWITKPREDLVDLYDFETFTTDTIFETKLSVTKETILHGIRIGDCSFEKIPIEINISTEKNDKLIFKVIGSNWWDLVINFGDSLRLASNCGYTITIRYLEVPDLKMEVGCRREGILGIINDSSSSVQILEMSRNVYELFFKTPED